MELQPISVSASDDLSFDHLDVPLGKTLAEAALSEILSLYWNIRVPKNAGAPVHQRYCQRYTTECTNAVQWSVLGAGGFVPTHRQLEQVHSLMKANSQESRAGLRLKLHESEAVGLKALMQDGSRDQIDAMITLALRIWTMLDFRDAGLDLDCLILSDVLGDGVSWTDEEGALNSFLYRKFLEAKPPLPKYSGSFTANVRTPFTARNLRKLAGIETRPTSNLADHLAFDEPTRTLYLFHFTAFLNAQLSNCTDDTQNPIFPFQRSYLKETLWTIELLFPSHDGKSKRYLLELNRRYSLDENILQPQSPPPASDDAFTFYRTRLAVLFNELHSTQTFSVMRLWTDRRDKQRWLTLWIAVVVLALTVFFGIVSSITSILQAYFSYKSYKLQEAQGIQR